MNVTKRCHRRSIKTLMWACRCNKVRIMQSDTSIEWLSTRRRQFTDGQDKMTCFVVYLK